MSGIEILKIKTKVLDHFDPDFGFPKFESIGASGVDVRAMLPQKNELCVSSGKRILVPTGLSIEIPPGFEVQIRPRSGLSLKTDLLIPNSPGTIDADYRGEVKILIFNCGEEDYQIQHGDRIAQMVLCPIFQFEFISVHDLEKTSRGDGGFGHTGVQ
ncbi:dUTP diphosphatase [Bacteriovoracaceae bacterium]|nr:dUTP diphosphatase [Bacteriovoracaceae bacterium]